MNEAVLRALTGRVKSLEQNAGIPRIGRVTVTTPLQVALGGASVSHPAKTLNGVAYAVGDNVVVLTWGNDLIVLGEIT